MWSHVAGLVALAVLVPVGLVAPVLATSAAATAVVVGLAAWDTRAHRLLAAG
jgi:hypothetical protein